MTKVTYTAGGSTYDAEYEYDGDGRLVNLLDWIDDVDGLEYAYDAAGRLTQLTDYDGTTLDYAYDAAGRVTSMNDYFSPCRLGLPRPNDNTSEDGLSVRGQTSQRGNRGQTRLTRGLVRLVQSPISGQVSTITAPGSKTWTYAYNALGQPTSVSIPCRLGLLRPNGNPPCRLGRPRPNGNRRQDGLSVRGQTSKRPCNGMTTEYGYDTRNRLTTIEHKDGATVLDGFTYALDAGGNITRTTQADSSLWVYEYDGRDRLTKAERYDTDGTTLLHRYSYTYDDGDNLLTELIYDGTNTVTTAFAYTNANEQTSMAVGGTTTTMGYDAWGRTTSKTDGTYSASYTYGPPGMLSTVTSDFPDEDDVTYVTGCDGARRSRTVDGTETWYNWAGPSVMNEENSAGVLTRTYFGHATAHVDGTTPSTGTYKYYFHDHLGSTRRLRSQDKSSLGVYEYTPYGEVYAESGDTSLTRRYAMLEWDSATEEYFAPFRYYMSGAGRWTSRDAMGDGLNSYSYVGAEPVSHIDPLGLCRSPGQSFWDCKKEMTQYELSLRQPVYGGEAFTSEAKEDLLAFGFGTVLPAIAVSLPAEINLPRLPMHVLVDFLTVSYTPSWLVLPSWALYSGTLGGSWTTAIAGTAVAGITVSPAVAAVAATGTFAVAYRATKHWVTPHTNAMVSCLFSCD